MLLPLPSFKLVSSESLEADTSSSDVKGEYGGAVMSESEITEP